MKWLVEHLIEILIEQPVYLPRKKGIEEWVSIPSRLYIIFLTTRDRRPEEGAVEKEIEIGGEMKVTIGGGETKVEVVEIRGEVTGDDQILLLLVAS
jgi:hypothetical protein